MTSPSRMEMGERDLSTLTFPDLLELCCQLRGRASRVDCSKELHEYAKHVFNETLQRYTIATRERPDEVVVMTGIYTAKSGGLLHRPEHHDHAVSFRGDSRLDQFDGQHVAVVVRNSEGE